MATFVLVHGAWHGSWCWKRVRSALQKLGHEVFTPTLTGVGERSHLLAPDIDLQRVQRVANEMYQFGMLARPFKVSTMLGGL